jgi:hypothetical protein
MTDEIKVNVTTEQDLTDALQDIQGAATRTERVVVQSMGSSEEAFDTAARSSGKLGEKLDYLSGAGSQLAGGLGDLGDSFAALKDLQNLSATRANEQARKLLDVEQAMQDTDQAARDLKQAQLDLNQAQIDSKQAGADVEQAQLDVKQAMLDAETAQNDYNEAVKEFGPGSAEAKQASQDLAQAQQDLKQANIDAEQATADKAQAEEDAKQATEDAAQAALDAKGAQLDLNEANLAAKPPSGFEEFGATMSAFAPLVMGAVGAIDLLILANNVLTASFLKNAAAQVASKVALVASTVATGLATAAQWLLNIAMTANPIGLIIAAIGLLVGAVIWVATKTTWFSDLWEWIWGKIGEPVKAAWEFIWGLIQWYIGLYVGAFNMIKDALIWAFKNAIDWVVGAWNWLLDLPNKLVRAFEWIGNALTWPFKTAFNWIARAWNNTIGSLSFRIPDWVPGIGGGSLSMPRLPTLARGGEVLRTGAALIHKGERIMPAGTRGLWNDSGGGEARVIELRITGGSAEFRRWFLKMIRQDETIKAALG